MTQTMEIGLLELHGELDRWRLPAPGHGLLHMLLSGITESGKSGTMNRIVARLATRSDVALIGLDFKGGLELRPWSPRLTAIATDVAEAEDLLPQVATGLIPARAGLIGDIAEAEGKSLRLWESRMGAWLVLLVDEMAELRSSKIALQALTSIAQVGRAAGVIVVAATQKALVASGSGSGFPSMLLTNLPGRVCHRMGTMLEYSTALNRPQEHLKLAGFTPIEEDQKGLAYVASVPGTPDLARVKATWMDDDRIPEIAAQTSRFRWRESQVLWTPSADWVLDRSRGTVVL